MLLAAGLGVWLGLDLRGGAAPEIADALYFLSLAFVAPLPVAAVGALYHDPLHGTLLPWPIAAGFHLRLGLRRLIGGQLGGALAAVGLGVGAGWGEPAPIAIALPLFCGVVYVGGLLAAIGCAGLCAAAAAVKAPWVVRLRQQAAGPFSSGRHAPFLYLPAFAFFAVAGAALVAQAGLLRILAATASGGGLVAGAGLIFAPLVAGLALLAAGVSSYRRFALQVIPRVIEEAKTVYGGRPAPADPPYGLGLSRLLPRAARPHYRRELREQARAHRGLWATLVLAMLVVLGYAVNIGDPVAAAPVAGVLLCVWAAGLPTRRTPRQSGAAFALTLPRPSAAAWFGRMFALLFAAGHLGLAVALALGHRHGVGAAAATTAVLVGAAALCIGATTPRIRRGGQQVGPRWGLVARLAAPLALCAGLVAALLSLPLGLALAGGLLLGGLLAGLAVPLRQRGEG